LYKGKAEGEFERKNWNKFNGILEAMKARNLTGNAAKKEWSELFETLSGAEKKWYTRILARDLRLGIGTTMTKKTWPNLISNFGCQLADLYEEYSKPLWAEAKIDGLRVLLVSGPGGVICYSRQGKELTTLSELFSDVKLKGKHFVLDAEVFLKDWNTTISLVKTSAERRKPGQDKQLEKLSLFVFDYLTLEEFAAGKSETPLEKRYETLQKLFGDSKHNIKVMEHKEVSNQTDIDKAYSIFVNKGYEGVMLKDPQAGYIFGRTKSWLKLKPEADMDAMIDGFEEGTGRNEGRLGALEVILASGERARVGSGFSDEQREGLWKVRKSLIGKTAEFRVQKDATAVASIRFPRFLRIREDLLL
jgi:DNA ligase-1